MSSFAKASETGDLEEITGSLDQVRSNMNELINSIKVRIGDTGDANPEYETSYKALVKRISYAQESFDKKILKIRDKAEVDLSKVYSTLSLLKKAIAKDPENSKHLKVKLAGVMESIPAIKGSIEKFANNVYRNAFLELYTLNDFFVFPVTKKYRLVNGVLCTAGFALVLFPGFICFEEMTRQGSYTVKYNTNRKTRMSKDDFRYYSRKYAHKLFEGCEEATCAFFLAQDYKYWSSEISNMNIDITLGEGITLKKLKMMKTQKVNDVIDSLVDIVIY